MNRPVLTPLGSGPIKELQVGRIIIAAYRNAFLAAGRFIYSKGYIDKAAGLGSRGVGYRSVVACENAEKY